MSPDLIRGSEARKRKIDKRAFCPTFTGMKIVQRHIRKFLRAGQLQAGG